MNKAKIIPVKKRIVPDYPDQYSVKLNHLLLANKPLRWNATPIAGTVLSAVVMFGLAGCTVNTTTPDIAPSAHTTTSEVPAITNLQTPFFEHGKGIGIYGCVAVAIPIFLSEDDAFAIIKDEFAKLDMSVQQEGITVSNILVPKFNPYLIFGGGSGTSYVGTTEGELTFDFSIINKNIMMEYITSDDMRAWVSVEPDENGTIWISTVSSYDFQGAARVLNNSLNSAQLENIHGVFYDPVVTYSSWEGYQADASNSEEARQKASDMLREQVRDFIAWLSAQGII